MDNVKIYFNIIKKAKSENRRKCRDTYYERHHILPRSLGGTDDERNTVLLTAKEHFIVHCLLARMFKIDSYEWYKMNHAMLIMKCASIGQHRYFNSRLYGNLKTNFSKVMSLAQSNEQNSQYNTCWISFVELKLTKKCKMSLLPEYIEQGWVKGRNKHVVIEKLEQKRKLKILKFNKQKTKFNKIFLDYLNSEHLTLSEYCRNEYGKSVVSLTRAFQKYVDGYTNISYQGGQYTKEKLKNHYLK